MLIAELATAVKYTLPIKIVVIKNNTLGQIKWEQMVFLGNPEYVCDLQPIDFAMVARACGATGLSVDRPEECGRVLEQADRKSTRLNSSHVRISYAVFCLKKKKKQK